MSTRVSTAGMFASSMAAMQLRQSQLAKTQQQVALGTKLITAKDDPVSAGTAVQLDRALAELERFDKNSAVLKHRLSLEESTLAEVGNRLTRIRELAVQGNGGVYDSSARRAITVELREHYDALVALANTGDGNGRYLFGGTEDTGVPFVQSGGAVSYVGDSTRRSIDIAPGIAVPDSDPGIDVFQRIRTGDGRVSIRPDAANAGNATLSATGITDPTAWDGGTYRVQFNAGNYQVLDASNAVVTSGAYTPGSAIAFRGVSVSVAGAPANGDQINVGPAPNRDVFATVKNLIDTLEAPDVTPQQKAAFQNGMYASLQDLGQAQDHLIDQRANIGARLATLDGSTDEREARGVSIKSTLSDLRDLDYAEAASRLSQEFTALQAAQQAFVKLQGLSLFNYLR